MLLLQLGDLLSDSSPPKSFFRKPIRTQIRLEQRVELSRRPLADHGVGTCSHVGDPPGEAPARLAGTPAGGPMPGERGTTPVGAGTPWRTCRQNVPHRTARGACGTPGGLVTFPCRITSPSASLAGAPCGDQPAAGPAGPRPGPARAGLPTRERAEGKRRRELRFRAGCAGLACAGLKIEMASDGYQESSMPQTEGGQIDP